MAFSLLSKIFGSDALVKKAADGVYNGVDAVFFTKEEKAENFKGLLNSYEPFRLAQRFLAVLVGIPYVGIWLLCTALFLSSATMTLFVDECLENEACKPKQVMIIAEKISAKNNATLGEPFIWICIFYFGGGALEGTARVIGERRDKKIKEIG